MSWVSAQKLVEEYGVKIEICPITFAPCFKIGEEKYKFEYNSVNELGISYEDLERITS